MRLLNRLFYNLYLDWSLRVDQFINTCLSHSKFRTHHWKYVITTVLLYETGENLWFENPGMQNEQNFILYSTRPLSRQTPIRVRALITVVYLRSIMKLACGQELSGHHAMGSHPVAMHLKPMVYRFHIHTG